MEVVIFEDGKHKRGSKARLVKRGNKRVLIEFKSYNFKTNKEELIVEWFSLFIPWYSGDKKKHKHNNKRKSALYLHKDTNEFYSDKYQTEQFKEYFKEHYKEAYCDSLFG